MSESGGSGVGRLASFSASELGSGRTGRVGSQAHSDSGVWSGLSSAGSSSALPPPPPYRMSSQRRPTHRIHRSLSDSRYADASGGGGGPPISASNRHSWAFSRVRFSLCALSFLFHFLQRYLTTFWGIVFCLPHSVSRPVRALFCRSKTPPHTCRPHRSGRER